MTLFKKKESLRSKEIVRRTEDSKVTEQALDDFEFSAKSIEKKVQWLCLPLEQSGFTLERSD